MIDLRGDTYTLPTEHMRRAMAQAEVGNDLVGEDPTVRALEELAARMLGKQAALFLPSGTMANLTALLTHTDAGRGLEVICEATAHPFSYEAGGAASLAGVQFHPLPGVRGAVRLEDMEAAIRADASLFPRTALIWLENTNNSAGGAVLPPEYMARVHALAQRRGLPVHIDGARLFNAAAALGVPAGELARHGESVMVSLNKGLSAPVGAMLCGGGDFIARARRYRLMLGGAMSQAGVLAAAGIVALTEMVDRLAEDNARARVLAGHLNGLPGVWVDLQAAQTNIVNFAIDPAYMSAGKMAERMYAGGVHVGTADANTGRLAVNRHITDGDIKTACAVFSTCFHAGQ